TQRRRPALDAVGQFSWNSSHHTPSPSPSWGGWLSRRRGRVGAARLFKRRAPLLPIPWGGGPRSGGGALSRALKPPLRLVGYAADPPPHVMGRRALNPHLDQRHRRHPPGAEALQRHLDPVGVEAHRHV